VAIGNNLILKMNGWILIFSIYMVIIMAENVVFLLRCGTKCCCLTIKFSFLSFIFPMPFADYTVYCKQYESELASRFV